MVLLMALVAGLHLGVLLLTTLFGYLALRAFTVRGRKAAAVAIYLVAVAIIVAGSMYFSQVAYRTFPRIAETAIPAMAAFAERNGVEVPVTDFESLKSTALEMAREGIATIGQYARVASVQFVLLVAGLVVAASLFLNLYESFARVIGAQIVISAINTVLTAVFLALNGYPFALLLPIFVFLCGLLPIVGNLVSNCVIIGVGFTLSPRTGLFALLFLVAIHKLEYFLNSKIVGRRIDSPMWLTLIGLVVGERLMGIAGMVLAPVLLNYIKVEASAYRAARRDAEP